MAEGSLGIKGVSLWLKWGDRMVEIHLFLLSKLFCSTGVSAAFAVKLFKSWINEKDINAVAASLRKVSMDNRLMVCNFFHSSPSCQHLKCNKGAFSFLICEKKWFFIDTI